jgi:hypothetical protein
LSVDHLEDSQLRQIFGYAKSLPDLNPKFYEIDKFMGETTDLSHSENPERMKMICFMGGTTEQIRENNRVGTFVLLENVVGNRQ